MMVLHKLEAGGVVNNKWGYQLDVVQLEIVLGHIYCCHDSGGFFGEVECVGNRRFG